MRLGAGLLIASLVILALTMADGPFAWVLVGGALLGAAFGFSWAFMVTRLLGALADEDRAVGSSGVTAVRQAGSAAGAALSGVAANLVGFSEGLNDASAEAAAVWIFVAAIPLSLIGTWALFRMTRATSPAAV